MLYMVTFTINIPQMLAYIPYMDPMGHGFYPEIGDSSGRPIHRICEMGGSERLGAIFLRWLVAHPT